ncbi:MAG: lipoate--protein ligase family protein [Candidatus Omnitrophica bacterium]|nr:lipoate--protein ligase family protein [Candidatus Omnitrophota bacterium]
MKYIDLTFPTPEHNLACDEALLELCEDGSGQEVLRFWEPHTYFVVLGYSGKANSEVNVSRCKAKNIPILRRSSGGGTVVQGPGCLNFSLVLEIRKLKPLANIVETNRYMMKQHQKALRPIIGREIEVQGFSDLACETLKFSGNAQRRKRRFVLFHGTFLLQFNIALIEELLPVPKKQPSYRENRPHLDFLTNLNVPSKTVKESLQKLWKAEDPFEEVPSEKINGLVQEKYGTSEWNFKY